MGSEFQPELWRDLYVMLGTSSAALIGLLYVVTSLHLEEIARNQVYRTRAYNNAIFLLLTLVEAVLILTPQPMSWLGFELAAVNLIGWSFPIRTSYRYYYKHQNLGKRGGLSPYRAALFHGCFLLAVVGAAGLIKGLSYGMYLTTASYVGLVAVVTMNAWSIMLGVAQAEKTKTER